MGYCEPADLTEVLWSNSVPPENAAALVQPYIDDASAAIDGHCHRSFTVPGDSDAATPRLFRPTRDGSMVDRLGDIAHDGDLSVEVRATADGAWTSTTHWVPIYDEEGTGRVLAIEASPGRVFRRSGRRGQTIRVTAHWGWPAVPLPVRRAAILYATRLHNRKSSPTGVMGFSDAGEVRLPAFDVDEKRLLAPFVRYDGGFA